MFYFQIVAMIIFGAQLMLSDARYSIYALVLLISFMCCIDNRNNKDIYAKAKSDIFANAMTNVFSCVFALIITAANYNVWWYDEIPEYVDGRLFFFYTTVMTIVMFMVFLVGGFIAFNNILKSLIVHVDKLGWKRQLYRGNAFMVFGISFLMIFLIRICVLIFCHYPGVLVPDSMSQLRQIATGAYTNHHPFYHTLTIRLLMDFGMKLFNEPNAAFATYSVFQIIFTSFTFSIIASTMVRMSVPRMIVCGSVAFFALMPYHIMYSITMWKDTFFSCFVALQIIFWYRSLSKIGHMKVNYILFFISSLGVCIYRSNGFIVCTLSCLIFVFLWRFREKTILIVLVLALLLGHILKYDVLKAYNVSQPDTIEALSIPAQQIARVISEGGSLNEGERQLLDEIVDVDRIANEYQNNCSDPIKHLVREKKNQSVIVEKKLQYIKLYLSLGLRYPGAFMRGWIDETKGYWNGGYQYPYLYSGVVDNPYGIELRSFSGKINNLFNLYLWFFEEIKGFDLLISIGFFIWIVLMLLFIGLVKRDKITILITMPIVFLDVTLLIATPVWAEFRYIYALFCTIPFLAVVTFRPKTVSA